jgi:gamma-glutamylcyclotransferase (GGCT)/AIG2-like uncharacterized protein YtfP
MRVAVYGSLKQGFGNHRVMEHAKGKLISAAITTEDHYILDGRGFPYINEAPSDPHKGALSVELYEVPKQGVLGPLDSLEGHPNFYERQQRTFNLPNGKTDTAWLYIYKRPITANPQFLENGTYTW